jgi:hypothetical protein
MNLFDGLKAPIVAIAEVVPRMVKAKGQGLTTRRCLLWRARIEILLLEPVKITFRLDKAYMRPFNKVGRQGFPVMIVLSYNDYKLLPLVDRINLVVKLKRYNLGFITDAPLSASAFSAYS